MLLAFVTLPFLACLCPRRVGVYVHLVARAAGPWSGSFSRLKLASCLRRLHFFRFFMVLIIRLDSSAPRRRANVPGFCSSSPPEKRHHYLYCPLQVTKAPGRVARTVSSTNRANRRSSNAVFMFILSSFYFDVMNTWKVLRRRRKFPRDVERGSPGGRLLPSKLVALTDGSDHGNRLERAC